ncbi:MAG: hypothetical protein COB67_03695 [SAR324 cluster bacterium]|uniref:Type II secretion system protein J n=1 Tax=SAR324 cluster bacterium TaxID=2024889 RepID=A0A2A4T8G4_9DELT|nr:MAG: hypothetical protein COB67_03695 [SAR324 cluster bacterium]
MKPLKSTFSSGFTLLELLITLTLFAAIMGVLLDTFFQFKQQNDRIESILTLRQEVRILEKILREDLQAAVYLKKFMSNPDRDDRKSGLFGINNSAGEQELDSIHMHVHRPSRFHRSLPPEKDPELHEVSFFMEETESDTFAFRRREEYYIDPDITEGDEGESITHTISQRVISFDLKYFSKNQDEALEEWDSSEITAGQDPLPAGLKVTLVLEDAKGEKMTTAFQINLHPQMGEDVTWEKK